MIKTHDYIETKKSHVEIYHDKSTKWMEYQGKFDITQRINTLKILNISNMIWKKSLIING